MVMSGVIGGASRKRRPLSPPEGCCKSPVMQRQNEKCTSGICRGTNLYCMNQGFMKTLMLRLDQKSVQRMVAMSFKFCNAKYAVLDSSTGTSVTVRTCL